LADELAATKDASERAAAQTALQTLRRNEWTDVVTTVARVVRARAELERRRDALRAKRRELAGVDAEVARLTEDLIEWQLLGQALGRDGLQTLEIDAAGPVVSAFCNDLLRACGLPFTVDLVTQQAKVSKGKDGSTQKEVFELKVYDSERGGVARDLADLSGGQQVLVDEALKSAIALLVNQRNVQPIRTCWRDETTGSLDPDTAQRYVEMLRRVHQLGGFHHVLFITHNPEAALQAAAQVVVNDGRAEVRLPPFTAEAA
jgi:exonuclease SbcC